MDNAMKPMEFIKHIEHAFSFTKAHAIKMIKDFHKEMGFGLKGKKSSLKMLPSFVKKPKGNERGTFLAIDLGGTNMRVLAVRLHGEGKFETIGVKRFSLNKEIISETEKVFFDFIVDCVINFLKEYHLDSIYEMGFTFSFPVVQTSVSSGTLVTWTKGFSVKDVEGKDVVFLLDNALKRKGVKSLKIIALVNDTVGTLATKCYEDPACDMGVILGTGTNASYPEKTEHITKYKGRWNSDEMIINIEWGGFDKINRNLYDETLDRNSENPGMQRMEKAISGMYLGEIARLVVLNGLKNNLFHTKTIEDIFSSPYAFTAEHLSYIALDDYNKLSWLKDIHDLDKKIIKMIAHIITTRSARIASSAIAAVITWMDNTLTSPHTVAIDGSLFEKYPGYKETMESTMVELFGEASKNIRLTLTHDGSGIGAAIIAAIVSSSPQ